MIRQFLSDKYFVGELAIPNLKVNADGYAGVSEMIQAAGGKYLRTYILQYEREYLEGLMGENMLSVFDEYCNSEDEEEKEWNDLKQMIFSYKGISFVSPAANYVYFMTMRDMQTQTSPQGEVRGRQDYSVIVSAYEKLVRVWNGMVAMSDDIRRFIRKNESIYGKMEGNIVWERVNKFGI